MLGTLAKRFEDPDEIKQLPKATHHIVHLGYMTASRTVLEPGFRWTECIRPIAETDSCQIHHTGFIVEGRLGVRMDDGTEMEFGTGGAYEIAPGHDAWTVGGEPVVLIEFRGAVEF
jgi:hypothetical protein